MSTMKYIHVMFVLMQSIIYSQNLTMNEIINIKNNDLVFAEEYLTTHGWEFLNAQQPSITNMGVATFSYKKDEMSSRAESFITYIYSDSSDRRRLLIQISNQAKYNEYTKSIKSFGCKVISSKIENGEIVKTYRGNTLTFVLKSGVSKNVYSEDTATWFINIYSNWDYETYANED